VFLILTTGFFLLTNVGGLFLSLFLDSAAGVDPNTIARIGLTSDVLDGWWTNFFGHGFGDYYLYGESYYGERIYYALHHNSYVTPLYFLGVIPGFVYIIGMLMVVFIPTDNNSFLEFLKISIFGFMVFAYFNLWFEHPMYAYVHWVLYGLLLSYRIKAVKGVN
jgi:hypothetical protein